MKKISECDVIKHTHPDDSFRRITIITIFQPLGHLSQLFLRQKVYFMTKSHFYKEQMISTPNTSVLLQLGFQPFFDIFLYFFLGFNLRVIEWRSPFLKTFSQSKVSSNVP